MISTVANIIPQDVHDLCAEFWGGNIEKSRELQLKMMDLIGAVFCEVNPIPIKTALKILGKINGGYRLPLVEMLPENEEKLRKAMEDYGIL